MVPVVNCMLFMFYCNLKTKSTPSMFSVPLRDCLWPQPPPPLPPSAPVILAFWLARFLPLAMFFLQMCSWLTRPLLQGSALGDLPEQPFLQNGSLPHLASLCGTSHTWRYKCNCLPVCCFSLLCEDRGLFCSAHHSISSSWARSRCSVNTVSMKWLVARRNMSPTVPSGIQGQEQDPQRPRLPTYCSISLISSLDNGILWDASKTEAVKQRIL